MVAMAIQLRAPCGQSANNHISAKTPLQPHCSLPHFEVLPQNIEIVLRARPAGRPLQVFYSLASMIWRASHSAVGFAAPQTTPKFCSPNRQCEAAETQPSEPGTDQSIARPATSVTASHNHSRAARRKANTKIDVAHQYQLHRQASSLLPFLCPCPFVTAHFILDAAASESMLSSSVPIPFSTAGACTLRSWRHATRCPRSINSASSAWPAD
jgi:hypothetical protein